MRLPTLMLLGVFFSLFCLLGVVFVRSSLHAERKAETPQTKVEEQEQDVPQPPRIMPISERTSIVPVNPPRPIVELPRNGAPNQEVVEKTRPPNNAEVAEQFRNAFVRERVDSAWSGGASAQIREALATHLPPGTSIRELECRQTMCSVELKHKSVEDFRNTIRTMLPGGEVPLWGGALNAVITTESDGDVTGAVFIAREGHQLPAMEMVSQN